MLPKIALVGRPNVGKSALFNRIAQKRLSIVDEQEGITRDRLYAKAELFGREFELIDTGGIDPTGTVPFNEEIKIQALFAVGEADALVLVVDGQVGPTALDAEVAKILRKSGKPAVIAINKMDRFDTSLDLSAYRSLGISELVAVSATQGSGLAELLEMALAHVSSECVVEEQVVDGTRIRVAIVGRPNVGKSTILNQLLDEERSIVSPLAGTTRDAIDVPIRVGSQDYLLIDTAGIRRKSAEKEVVDKFAAIRTEEAIDRADVCLLVLDSYEGITTQEKRIASIIEEKGKSCVILFNKWDLVKGLRMEHAMRGVREQVPFLNHCPTLFLSAIERRNLEKIFPLIDKVYQERYRRIGTGQLNKFIEACQQKYHPPLIIGKRLRIYYMTQVQTAPPKFVVFVNNPTLMTDTYQKYLVNQLRSEFLFSGCPVVLELRGKGPGRTKAEEAAVEVAVAPAVPLLIDKA